MKRSILLLSFSIIALSLTAQTKSVLFIGNSYTNVNNLPQLVKDLALSVNDTLIFDNHTPGGAQMQQHANSAAAHQKIKSQQWDHVVLQSQSQEPSFNQMQVQQWVYPYATQLCDSIRANNNCARPIFYRTWGRKNGDASNCPTAPWLCTYAGMDSALAFSYRKMANDNDAWLSPVGDLWKYLRTNHPGIELYSPDESHPSLAGSYAAACCFYSVIFQKNPGLLTFKSSLSTTDAQTIRQACKTVVYDSLLKWNVGIYKPSANFVYQQQMGSTFSFVDSSTNATSWLWLFGDGQSDTVQNPTHTYSQPGNYQITLIVSNGCQVDSISVPLPILSTAEFANISLKIYPNPSGEHINIEGMENLEIDQLLLLSNDGKTIREFSDAIPHQISLQNVAKGQYHLIFKNKGQTTQKQSFVKL